METTYLTDYIQNMVEEVALHNEPFDDTKRKWLRRYGSLVQMTDDECEVLINKLDLFFETLQELETKNSKYLELSANMLGQDLGISKAALEGFLEHHNGIRKENAAKMEDEIQANMAATREAKEMCKKETASLKALESQIRETENAKALVFQNAKQKALGKNQQQWDQDNQTCQMLEDQCQREKKRLADLTQKENALRTEIQEFQKQKQIIKLKRMEIIHGILLVPLAVLLCIMEFRILGERGLAWVPLILTILFVSVRFSLISELGDYGRYPELLFSLLPLAFIHFEAFFIEDLCGREWLLSFLILIPTTALFLFYEVFLYDECDSKKVAIHHFLLGASALLVSLAEFFTFSYDVFYHLPYDCYGWGWAFFPLLFNLGWVGYNIALFDENANTPTWKMYLYSFGSLLLANVVAYLTRNGWVLLMVLVYIGLGLLGQFVFIKPNNNSNR